MILVAKCPREMVESMHMRYAVDLNETIAMAEQMAPNGTMAVIPDGVRVIVDA